MGDHLFAVVPPSAETVLDAFGPVIVAAQDAYALSHSTLARHRPDRVAADVSVVQDEDLGCDTIDILGKDASISLPVRCKLPFLVVQFKDLGAFLSIELKLVDVQKRIRTVSFSNKQSVVRVTSDTCHSVLNVHDGWNYCCIDLGIVQRDAFGVEHAFCKEIVIHGTMRLARVFFQDAMYSDEELPTFLRVQK